MPCWLWPYSSCSTVSRLNALIILISWLSPSRHAATPSPARRSLERRAHSTHASATRTGELARRHRSRGLERARGRQPVPAARVSLRARAELLRRRRDDVATVLRRRPGRARARRGAATLY